MSHDIELGVRRNNARLIIPDPEDSKTVEPIIGYAQEPLLPLAEACKPLIVIVHNILAYVSIALEKSPNHPADGLTHDESASIFLYTMEWNDGHRSLYSILNGTLRTGDFRQLKPWFKYLKLFLTALVKLPCAPQQTVWRGVRRDLSADFPQKTRVTWWCFSSCTITLPVLEGDLYLGQKGTRTLFSIEVCNGRNIRNHSYFQNEDEILLLPATYMEVQSQSNPAPDLHIVHLEQIVPDDMLLELPFEGALLYPKNSELSRRRRYKKKRFIISVSLLAVIIIVAVILGSVLGSKLTHNGPDQTCSNFVRKDNWDIPLNDILPIPLQKPDYDSCCSQCQSTSDCFAFTYSPSSHNCSLKKCIGSGRNSTDNTVTGYNQNMCYGFSRRNDWNIPDNDILPSPIQQPDYASCCSQCQANSECNAFTYLPSRNECSLKTSTGTRGNSVVGSITGYNPNMCGGFIRKDNWDIPGNDILSSPIKQIDYATCCSQCQSTSGCVAFSYSSSTNECSLKTSIDGARNSTDENIISYYFNPLRGSSSDIYLQSRWEENGIIVAGGNNRGSSLNQLDHPWGLYIDDNDTIYVADYLNHRIMKWEQNATNGEVVAGGSGPGNRNDQLNLPYDVIVDKERDRLIICDSVNRRVVQWPRSNGKSGEIIASDLDCWGLTMDDYGSLYVVEPEKYKIIRFKINDTQGTVIAGGNGQGNRFNQFDHPRNIFIDRDYSIYVSEWGNHRVMKWAESEQSAIVVAGNEGQGNGFNQLSVPKGIVVDQSGTVYVADTGNSRVMRWPKGAMEGIVIIGKNGGGGASNQLKDPGGLSFDRDGNLYVVDVENHRVQKFKIDRTPNNS